MMNKAWNIRDQTDETLEEMLLKKYDEINKSYKLLKKLSTIEDATKMLDEIYRMKAFCNELYNELYRRRFTGGD